MKQKLLAATVAGGLLVGAGFTAASLANPGVASAQDDSPDSTEETNVGPLEVHGSVLEDVLSDLVEDGTIDQGQADAIVEALDAKTAESRTAPEDVRGLIAGFLEDGGIDQEEYDSLPDDHPLKQVDMTEYLADGIITLDELRELKKSQSDSGDAA